MEEEFELNFKGYWNEAEQEEIPAEAGIYCVYLVQNDFIKKDSLIYIGEAEDVRHRIKNHEKSKDWRSLCDENKYLAFTFSSEEVENRGKRPEAALIFEHQPTTNDQNKKSFDYEDTTINIIGKTSQLETNFTVLKGSKNTN